MANTIQQCLWCKADIAEGQEVWIERQKDEDGYDGWDAFFCGNEHASMGWPIRFRTRSSAPAEGGWGDRLFMVGCLGILVILLGVFVVGVLVSAGWIIDRLS